MRNPSTSSNQRQRSVQNNTAVTYFVSPCEFREWLSRNHDKASALWVGFHKKKSGKIKPNLSAKPGANKLKSFTGRRIRRRNAHTRLNPARSDPVRCPMDLEPDLDFGVPRRREDRQTLRRSRPIRCGARSVRKGHTVIFLVGQQRKAATTSLNAGAIPFNRAQSIINRGIASSVLGF